MKSKQESCDMAGRDEEGGGELEEDPGSKSAMEEEGEVVVEGGGSAQKNSDKINSEGDGDLEADSGKEAGDGGTRKQKCRKKRPKTTTPVSETPFQIFYCIQYCRCY